jgi:DNA-directed RNA polymerase subunit beta'
MDQLFKNIVDFKALQIKIASPESISSWSHGEVTKPETINYRTLKPEKDGLFCEQIFGPVKDWECHCGKYKRIRYRGIICDKCGVEVTLSRVRRERMGHITLACPVAHVWYFKGAPPSHLALLVNIPPKSLESVIYFAQYVVTNTDDKKRTETIKNLEQQLSSQLQELQNQTKKTISDLKKQAKLQSQQLQKKINQKDQLNLARQELQLKTKRQIQAQRESHLAQSSQVKQLFDQLHQTVKNLKNSHILSEEDFIQLADHQASDFFEVNMGAEALLKLIKNIDLKKTIKLLHQETESTKGQRRLKASKRLKFFTALNKAQIDPSWMILDTLPVLPPDLRPMVQLSGGRFATSDLNDLYRRVINRNNRLKHLINLGAPEIILRNEKRMLQEAVDNLFDASQKRTTRRIRRQPLRSLSDMLRGKQGRFRQNLLGKRVDYSARSVIVVGPELNLSECGLPKDIALEMFKPFVLRQMIISGLSPNVRSAKALLERRPPEVYDILESSLSSSTATPSSSTLVFVLPLTLTSTVTKWQFTYRSPKKPNKNPLISCSLITIFSSPPTDPPSLFPPQKKWPSVLITSPLSTPP